MLATASSRDSRWVVVAWAAFSGLNVLAMWLGPGLETIPFHLVWVSLALVYGFQVWRLDRALIACAVVAVMTGIPLVNHARGRIIALEEISEIPLMSLLFMVVVWHVHRRSAAEAEARRAAERERVAVRLQERFVRLASHELRTPITVARGYTEMLRMEAQDPRVVEDAEVVLDELRKLERIAGGLLALAWAHKAGAAGGAGFRTVAVDALAHRVARRWAPVTGQPLRAEVAPATALGDEDRLETALDCLVENAIRHTGNEASIVLRAYSRAGSVVLEVEDDGPGIRCAVIAEGSAPVSPAGPPVSATPAFSTLPPQASPAAPVAAGPTSGAGLGLTIVRGIVEAHGGSLTLGSGEHGGLRATIRLPAARRAAPAGPALAPAPAPAG